MRKSDRFLGFVVLFYIMLEVAELFVCTVQFGVVGLGLDLMCGVVGFGFGFNML
jgi:hypothetical protein